MRLALVGVTTVVVGCGGTARNATAYREDTSKLLETRTAMVKQCYDAALAKDPATSATITVSFVVEKQTGVIRQAAIVPEKSTNVPALYPCVLDALAGLTLAPADKRDAHATFVYQLKPG